MPTKSGIILPAEGSAGNKEQWGFSQINPSNPLRRAPAGVIVDADSFDPIVVGGRPVGLDWRESATYPGANEYWPRLMWRVPSGKRFYPMRCDFGGITAGGNCEWCIATKWAEYDLGTNVFTDAGGDFNPVYTGAGVGQALANRFHQRITGRVRTTLSAVATNLTITATSMHGPNTVALTQAYIASHAAGRIVTSFPQATQIGQPASGGSPVDYAFLDSGFVGISNVVEAPSTAATGVVEFFGETVIGEGRHAANDSRMIEVTLPGSVWVDAGDLIIVYGAQPAVTAYQREFSFSGILTDTPA